MEQNEQTRIVIRIVLKISKDELPVQIKDELPVQIKDELPVQIKDELPVQMKDESNQ
jgi:hypothetical protein